MLFEKMMETLLQATSEKENVEVLCAIDSDDSTMLPLIKELEFSYQQINLRFFIVERSMNFNEAYYNFLAKKCSGRFIMIINDDVEFKTENWDAIVYTRMAGFANPAGDDLFLGLVRDGIKRTGEDPLYPHFSCWPIMSKEQVEKFGYFFHPGLWNWGSDHLCADIYRRLSNIIKENRLVSLVDVFIWHNSHHTGGRLDDGTRDYFIQIEREHGYRLSEEEMMAEAIKYADYIKQKRGG